MNKLFFKRLSYLILAFAIMGALKTILARRANVKSQDRFYKIISKPRYNLAIVMFYDSSKTMRREDPQEYETIKSMESIFKNTSMVFRYDDADLIFISVNMCNKGNAAFADVYNIKFSPTFILFKDGQPYKDKAGNMAILTGFASRARLDKFIDSHYKELIEKNRKRNREIRDKKIEQNLARSYYWGWGCGGPYWGGCGGWGGYGGCWGGYGGWGGCGGWGGWRGCGGRRGCGGGYRRGCCRGGGGCRRRCR
ncbi:hypothetical protein ACFLYU_01370 [Candidatus Dependentiae bacterium]